MTADPPDTRAHPNTLPCADCGHVWFAGARRHEYAGGSGEEYEVLCVLCLRRDA